MSMAIDLEKLMEELIFSTPRKDEPEFLLTKPREELIKKIEKIRDSNVV